jgi:hypothetical protein
MAERRSTISKSILPVGQSTQELFALLSTPGGQFEDIINALADADERDCYAVGNLLYAWRTGQLA